MAGDEGEWVMAVKGGRRGKFNRPAGGGGGDHLRPEQKYDYNGNHRQQKHIYIPGKSVASATPMEIAAEAVMATPETIVARVVGRGWFSLIERINHSVEDLLHILTVLDTACGCPDPVERADFLRSTFAKNSLYLSFMATLMEKHYSAKLIQVASYIFATLAKLSSIYPRLFGPMCLQLGKLVQVDHTTDDSDEWSIDSREATISLESLRQQVAALMTTANVPSEEKVVIGEYPSGANPPDNFRLIPTYPRSQDIDGKLPFLRRNIVRGPYDNLEQYLDIQFRLLREDYMIPLREGIQSLRGGPGTTRSGNKRPRRADGITHYMKVRYVEQAVNERNEFMGCKLRLCQAKRSQEVFKYGSLVGLSKDHLRSFRFFICVQAVSNELLVIPCNERERGYLQQYVEYDMIELNGAYYESYRHTLDALKRITTLPLQSIIVDLSDISGMPRHWREHRVIVLPFSRHANRPYELSRLPPVEDVMMNASQYEAFRLAINKKLCLIQGPPGTGKTYVGLRIVETLLRNDISKKPILVVCYTNHALDQFLEGMLKFTRSIVRVGGRSKSDLLTEFSLDRLRENAKMQDGRERMALRKRVAGLKDDLSKIERQIGEAEGWMLIGNRSKLGQSCGILSRIKNLEDFLELSLLCQTEQTIDGVVPDNFGRTVTAADLRQEMELLEYSRTKIRVQDAREHIIEQRLSRSRPLGDYAFKMIAKKIYHEVLREGLPELSGLKPRKPLTLNEKWRFYATVHWKIVNETIGEKSQPRDPNGPGEPLTGFVRLQERLRDCRRILMSRHQALTNEIATISARVSEIIDQHLASLISTRRIIGLTTSGAVSRLPMLAQIGSEIVVVEEAAELLEPHLITVLSHSTKQLVLIGDHQQLQPKISGSSYVLEANFNMTVSLFERLVTNGMQFVQLNEQHRMRDEFIRLLVPDIYPQIKSAPHVFQYPDIRGMAQNLQFVNHNFSEKAGALGESSKTNPHEVDLIHGLVSYLLLHGYQRSQIVILTAYKGQCSKFTAKDARFSAGGIRVSTIDDYQGEESDIVIVSFVRSNNQGRIGFLGVSNRVCVALSRAKMGLFCVGNFLMYRESSPLWRSIIQKLLARNAIDCGWRLRCSTHGTVQCVTTAEDMVAKSPRGGCSSPCGVRMDCGHACTSQCHAAANHPICEKPCAYVHPNCGHTCTYRCFQPHGKCVVPVERTLECGHVAEVKCFVPEDGFRCQEPCVKPLHCGHSCRNVCSQPCTKSCAELVLITRTCGHDGTSPCSEQEENVAQRNCNIKVDVDLPCGHRTSTKCSHSVDLDRLMKKCTATVKNVKLRCGHEVSMLCFAHQQVHDHQCDVEVEVPLLCGHHVRVPCCKSENIEHLTRICVQNVEVESDCGHTVSLACNLSNAAAAHCRSEVIVPLHCGHDAAVPCNDSKIFGVISHLTNSCRTPVNAKCPFGHPVEVDCRMKNVATHVASSCETVIKDIEAACRHKVNALCRYRNQPTYLRSLCRVIKNVSLQCGHGMDVECIDTRNKHQLSRNCHQQVDNTLPCGHVERQTCLGRRGNPSKICRRNCESILPCGHPCSGDCYDCYAGRFHMPCTQRCTRQCSFGHPCKDLCAKPCPPCKEACSRECRHGKCLAECGQPCSTTKMGCRKVRLDHCSHQQEQACPAKCCWDCTCAPCPHVCGKRLDCNHTCVGMCGEPCVPCVHCRVDRKTSKKKKKKATDLPVNEHDSRPLLTVPGCGHVVHTEVMDALVSECKVKSEVLRCPTCETPIVAIWRRYNAVLNDIYRRHHPTAARVNDIKEHRARLLERINGHLQTQGRIGLKKLRDHRGMQNHFTLEILEELAPKVRQGKHDQLALFELTTNILEALIDSQNNAMEALQKQQWKIVRNHLNGLMQDVYETLLDMVRGSKKGKWSRSRLHDVLIDATRLKAALFLPMNIPKHCREQLMEAVMSPARFDMHAVDRLLQGALHWFKKLTPILEVESQ